MAPQFATGIQGIPAGAQIIPSGVQFQAPSGQFATADTISQPVVQQALQQDPQDPSKWQVVQVSTMPANLTSVPAALQALPDAVLPATHTAQHVTTLAAAAIAPNSDRNGKFFLVKLILVNW